MRCPRAQNIPRVQQNCRLHCPSALRSRPADSPAFYNRHCQLRAKGTRISQPMLTCTVCEPARTVSSALHWLCVCSGSNVQSRWSCWPPGPTDWMCPSRHQLDKSLRPPQCAAATCCRPRDGLTHRVRTPAAECAPNRCYVMCAASGWRAKGVARKFLGCGLRCERMSNRARQQ